MRSISNFLLFENVLDNIDYSNPYLAQVAAPIFKPTVTIVQENCGTTLGKRIDVDLSVNGLVRMDWNGSLNVDRTIPEAYRISKLDIQTWLGQSIYSTYIRDIHYCTSIGGVCSACYTSSIGGAAPLVGTRVTIENRYIVHTDNYATNTSPQFTLSVSSEAYDYIVVYLDNHPLSSSEYITDRINLTLVTPPVYGQFLSINYYAISNKPFLYYLSKTFSGDILGVEPISYQELFLPASVVDRGVVVNNLDQLQGELQDIGKVDQIYLDYAARITNKIERGILLIILYIMYNDVQS